MAGGTCFNGWWEPEEEWLWPLKLFLKLKSVFCKQGTSIKIKISMTCVSKEYEIKTNMVHEKRLQLQMLFYWVITWKFLFKGGELILLGRDKNFLRESLLGGFFQVGGMSKLSPPVAKTLQWAAARLTQPLILLRLIKWVQGISGYLLVKVTYHLAVLLYLWGSWTPFIKRDHFLCSSCGLGVKPLYTKVLYRIPKC